MTGLSERSPASLSTLRQLESAYMVVLSIPQCDLEGIIWSWIWGPSLSASLSSFSQRYSYHLDRNVYFGSVCCNPISLSLPWGLAVCLTVTSVPYLTVICWMLSCLKSWEIWSYENLVLWSLLLYEWIPHFNCFFRKWSWFSSTIISIKIK